VLASDPIVCVAKNRSNRLAYSEPFEVGGESSPEAVPSFPLNACFPEWFLHVATIQGVEINSVACPIREDRAIVARCRSSII
jgi:hypothetical protein